MTLDQIPFSSVDFADNPEPRCACVLVLDTSASMEGAPIEELISGLAAFREELACDPLARKRVELAVVSFGPVRVEAGFRSADAFVPPVLEASDATPMGAAVLAGLELIRARKEEYAAHGVPHYRPWVFLVTDGRPTDDWRHAAEMVRRGEAAGAFSFSGVGVGGADMRILAQLCPPTRRPRHMSGLRFREMFVWLSSSLGGVSRSQVGDTLRLPPPDGWSTI